MRWTALQPEEQRSVKSMLDMHGKTVLITGGSGGIGRACALALAELGADVVLTGTRRSREKLESYCRYLEGKYGGRAVGICCDVSREEEVDALFAAIREQFGDLHVAFSNAGFFPRADSADAPIEEFSRTLAVDVTGTLLVCRNAANLMMERGHGGSLILNASMTGHIVNRREDGARYHVAYPAAKGAVLQLTKALALDYAQFGIRVNSVSPGYILSGIHDGRAQSYFDYTRENVPMKRYGTLDEIVGSVVYYACDLSGYTTGADLLVDGGYCAW
ncbi:short-chain dehydrogenase [Oscillospiraceae bacterium]|nr:short-chain dehydrogenase [Oscillospiraceae bacterium]BDF76452.1 short-chain dehydrogenase [Oscillospiraceae bacterium]